MYTSVKKLAIFSFILSILCVVAALLLLIEFAGYGDFTRKFTWTLFVVTLSGGFGFISWGLFSLAKDLDREYVSNSEYLHKLNKRIKELEDKNSL